MIELSDFLCLAHDIVSNQRSAEAVCRGVLVAAMHNLSVEEHHIARLHQSGGWLHTFWQRHSNIRKALRGIGGDGTQNVPIRAACYHLHTTVRLVTIVQRHPSCYRGSGLHLEIILIL